MKSVPQLAEYLKTNTRYKSVLSGTDVEGIHRGQLEARLHRLIAKDLQSFLAFSDTSAKFFLNIFAIRDEIRYIKILLRFISAGKNSGSFSYRLEGEYYSGIDFTALAQEKTVEGVLKRLRGTPYEKPLRSFMPKQSEKNLFEMETALDLFYKATAISYMAKFLSKEERSIAERVFGTEDDLYNIMFIIRAKKYYKIANESIYPYVGLEGYRLKKETVKSLVEAETVDELLNAAQKSCYGKIFCGSLSGAEKRIQEYILKLHRQMFRKSPYSIEAILYYIKIRETEIKNIIMITEGIRYGLAPEETYSCLIGLGGN